jgi:MFS family permease
MTRRAAFGALLRREHYVPFALTVTLARTSSMMFTTGGVLFVLARTHSAALAGWTAAAATLPGSLSGPLLGAWLDVARHRRLLIVTDQLLSVIGLVAILALAGHGPSWTLPAVAIVYSITRPLSVGSFFGTLNEVAGPELIDTASTIEASSLNFAFLIGPALAGALAGASSPTVAIETQAGLTLGVAGLIAINPVFELRSQHRAVDARSALRDGLRSILASRLMRSLGIASVLASLGWGLMSLGFPLYAVHSLHTGAHASGWLWAAVAGGSILGTFVLHGPPAPRRIALSYALLGVSALLWPLAHLLTIGILLIGLTGFLEGPAYSGTIAVRQRHAPPALRGQVINTLAGANTVALATGSALGGAIGHPLPLIFAFVLINLVAAAVVAGSPRDPVTLRP